MRKKNKRDSNFRSHLKNAQVLERTIFRKWFFSTICFKKEFKSYEHIQRYDPKLSKIEKIKS